MKGRLVIWKHDCIRDGFVDAQGEHPCDPPCDEPWQVDATWPMRGGVFTTHAEAMAYAAQLLNGVQPLRGGDLVEWVGEPGKWRVITSNFYDDKYVSIQREQGNRVIMGVPCEELKRIEVAEG